MSEAHSAKWKLHSRKAAPVNVRNTVSKALTLKSWTDTDVNRPIADTNIFLLSLIFFIVNYFPSCAWEPLTDNIIPYNTTERAQIQSYKQINL